MKKVIRFYTKTIYGNPLDYVLEKGDAEIISKLIGKRTISSVERELIRDLSGGLVEFKEVLAPRVN